MIGDGGKTCWVIADDGKVGTLSQCLGLAAALSLTPRVFTARYRGIDRFLPSAWRLCPMGGVVDAAHGSPPLPPWPDLVIGGGRASSAPVARIRRLSRGQTKAVQILNPYRPLKDFDAVIVPDHDQLTGSNVICTTGTLHGVTDATLEQGARHWMGAFAHLPRPWIGVLMGGGNRVYPFTPKDLESLTQKVTALAAMTGGSILVTPSRRTDPFHREKFKEALRPIPHFFWNGTGENPYMGILGLSDALVITADSISMISEAAFTGKPVLIHDLEGGSPKFKRFHHTMAVKGHTRPFQLPITLTPCIPLREREGVAESLRTLIGF